MSETTPTTMRRVTQDSFGGPEVLRIVDDAPVPEPIPTEIRVRVTAAGVNPVDGKVRQGGGLGDDMNAPPFTVGWDVAGVVDAIGMGVTRFAVGDRVYGMPWFPREAGAYGEYVTAPSRHFAHVPDAISDVTAGATPLAALTAWQIIVETADVQLGQRVLIHAAGGGVGHLAVQIAKARGAYVYGTASESKHDELRAMGCDELVDYRSTRFEDVARDLDVVVDLTEDYGLRSLDVLKPGGLLVCVPSGVPEEVAQAASEQGKRAVWFLVEPDGVALTGIARLIEEGNLRVRIAGEYTLDDVVEAHRQLETGSTFGKLVLTL